jgi:hypothetical protein
MQIRFASSISSFQLAQLETLIDEYLVGYKNSFDLDIIPKMHHLVHYPRIIREIGPLGAFWCMRYEAKHSLFKQLQRRIRNYINVPKTLSHRHQQWQCQQFLSSGNKLLSFKYSVQSRFKQRLLSSMKCAGQIAILLNIMILSVNVDVFKWIKIGSTLFKAGTTIILVMCQSGLHQFGRIVNIVRYLE